MIGNYSYSSLLVCSKLLGFYCLESLGQSFDFRKFSEITDWKLKTMRVNWMWILLFVSFRLSGGPIKAH